MRSGSSNTTPVTMPPPKLRRRTYGDLLQLPLQAQPLAQHRRQHHAAHIDRPPSRPHTLSGWPSSRTSIFCSCSSKSRLTGLP